MMRNAGATYLSPSLGRTRLNLARLFSFFTAFLLLSLTIFGSSASLFFDKNAFAEEETPEQSMQKAAKEYGIEDGEKSLDSLFEKWQTQGDGGDDKSEKNRARFGYVINRFFNLGYINHTPDGVAPSNYDYHEWNCKADDPRRNTLLYHNCDVPNVVTEIAQGIVQLISPMGMTNATNESAYSDFGFGIPSVIPGGTDKDNGVVPIDPKQRQIKYTGLELFGYNMKYTVYRGEWDNIRTMNEARALSNFGLFDDLKLGAMSIVNGVTNGLKNSGTDAIEGFTNGGIIGMAVGSFKGFYEGESMGIVNTIVDTSDMNVFNTWSWYRVNYGGTLYMGRELSIQEQKQMMSLQIKALLTGSMPEDAEISPEYQSLQAGPPKPKDNISKCEFGGKEYGAGTIAPGVTKEECEAQAKNANQTATWSETGNIKGQTLKEWYVANEAAIKKGKEVGIECPIDTKSEDDRANRLNTFYACWNKGWMANRQKNLEDNQTVQNQSWFKKFTKIGTLIQEYHRIKSQNFNAPWNRFVCTDAEGKDLISSRNFEFIYLTSGELNPKCKKVRPPVQNGYFGNGYLEGQGDAENPQGPIGIDTRYQVSQQYSLLSAIIDPNAAAGTFANFMLSIASGLTKVSNTVLDIAYQPLFEKLGLTDKIVSFIEALRESVYFGLIVLMIGVSVITIFIKTLKDRTYGRGFRDIFKLVAIFFLSVVALFSPRAMINLVDTVPSKIELAVAGAIFTTGNSQDDALCSAAQTVEEKAEDLKGGTVEFSPRASIRTMTCQVWRVFVFEPYVAGQWGTSYSNLYAVNAPIKEGHTMNNTNGDLVGNAGVYMGNGNWVWNWGLYQLDVMTTGTSTSKDTVNASGYVPRDLYRVVDLQSGPDNGNGTDGRYLQTWSGVDQGGRALAAFLAALSSFIGMLVICALALAKIQMTFVSIILLLFMPFVLLIGIHPTFGKVQLKKYVGTIISLMVQRILLVTYLAVMIRILTELSLAATDYLITGTIASAICLAFLINRNKFLELVKTSTERVTGGGFASSFVNNPTRSLSTHMPRTGKNMTNYVRGQVNGTVTGATGGFLAGGLGGIATGVQGSREREKVRSQLHQRRNGGVGAAMGVANAVSAGKKSAISEVRKSDSYKETSLILTERRRNEVKQKTGNPQIRVDAFRMNLSENKFDLRDMNEIKKIDDRIDQIERKHSIKPKRPKIRPGETIKDVKERQDAIVDQRRAEKNEIEELMQRKDTLIDDIYERQDNVDYRGDSHLDNMKRDLNRLRQDFENSLNEKLESRDNNYLISKIESVEEEYEEDQEYYKNRNTTPNETGD